MPGEAAAPAAPTTLIAPPAPPAAGAPATPPAPAPAAASNTPAGADPASPATLLAAPPAEVALKFPDGFKEDPATVEWLKGLEKMPPATARQAIVDEYAKRTTEVRAAEAQAFDSFVKTNAENVKKEWGVDYAKNLALAQKAIARFDPDRKLTELLSGLGLGTHPVILNHLKQLGAAFAEDNSNRGGKPATPVDNSPEAIMRQTFPNSPEMFKGTT